MKKDVKDYFKKLRFDEKQHLGLGDIRLSLYDQEKILELIPNDGKDEYFTAAIKKDSSFVDMFFKVLNEEETEVLAVSKHAEYSQYVIEILPFTPTDLWNTYTNLTTSTKDEFEAAFTEVLSFVYSLQENLKF